LSSENRPKISKRLRRLVESPICPAEDVKKYTSELKQLLEEVTDNRRVRLTSKFFKALSDETRIRILSLLKIREMCVCELMVALNLTQPATSHHLGILENVNLVQGRREGRWVFYRLTNPEVIPILEEGERISSIS